ncbi:Myosin-binding protein 7 [Carex littledalei]|uniref:Myosin-binding protein 7 n=1 Tax=Carex littledalei TaxID=544730 RepID=A0A833RAR4_9POAL|nr:Myosin-binding protein 7 [Carex littledalei]
MSEDDVQILRKALENQQITVQKLQVELDEERKAAASGAEEALSMILRLQGEKSTQKMESLHYKRMVEEKLQHNEEAMAVMREIIFLKDTETEALRYQIDVCKSKLLSLCLEGGSFPWLSGYISGKGEHNLGRKNISLPSIRFEELCREIDDLKQGNAGSFFDTKTYKERKLDNLFRSKSSMKEICSVSDGSKSESYDSEGDFSPLKLHCGEIPFLTPQKKCPRRTSSLALLHDSCTETESTNNPQGIFEIPESLKGKREYNLNSGNEERVQKSMTKSDCEHDKVSTGCVEIEMRKMRESDSVALKKQMELLAEIRNKINALESHILQRDGRIEEESSDRHKQMTASCMPQLREPSTNQLDDQLISYYMEVFVL